MKLGQVSATDVRNNQGMTSSLHIKAEDLSVGDTLLLPFGREATIKKIHPVGPRTRYVRFTTEHGATRVEVGTEVLVKAQAL